MFGIKYSIVIPFTRRWCVVPFFDSFAKMDIPNWTEVICYVDTGDDELVGEIEREINLISYKFDNIKILRGSREPHLNDDISECRKRIINVHNALKQQVVGDIVLCIEDDTIAPQNAFTRIIQILERNNDVGYVEGIEVGRRIYRVYGVWEVSDNGDIVKTAKRGQNLQEIQGGGFYCFGVRGDIYRNYNFEQLIEGYEFLGPDFNFVYSIARTGLKCLADWQIDCGHMSTPHMTLYPEHARHQAVFIRDENGRWQNKLEML